MEMNDSGAKLTNWPRVVMVGVIILIIAGAVIWYKVAGGKQSGTQNEAGLFPFVSMQQWGFMDSGGKIIIEPQFDGVVAIPPYFTDGLAPVQVDKKWGYIDESGKMVIKPQFQDAWPFHEGLAAVRPVNTRETAYIDKTGQIVVKSVAAVNGYTRSGSTVRIGDIYGEVSKWGWYNKAVYEPTVEGQPGSYSNGLLKVDKNAGWGSDGECGFMAGDGSMAVQPQYVEALDFSEGLAAVRIEDKWGYIDTKGNQVIEPQYDKAGGFSEGLAVFGKGDDLNNNNDTFYGFDYNPDSEFYGGKWGYIRKTGEIAATPQYDGAKPFSEGLAAVCIGDSWGYIDKEMKIAISPKYSEVSGFSEGLAAVCLSGKWGYVDKKGNEVIKAQFDQAGEFSGGLAQVVRDDRRGYVNTGGKVVRWDEN